MALWTWNSECGLSTAGCRISVGGVKPFLLCILSQPPIPRLWRCPTLRVILLCLHLPWFPCFRLQSVQCGSEMDASGGDSTRRNHWQ